MKIDAQKSFINLTYKQIYAQMSTKINSDYFYEQINSMSESTISNIGDCINIGEKQLSITVNGEEM